MASQGPSQNCYLSAMIRARDDVVTKARGARLDWTNVTEVGIILSDGNYGT